MQLAAAYPNRIYKIILVNSTARFTNEPGYTAGLSPAIVKRLAKQLNQGRKISLTPAYTCSPVQGIFRFILSLIPFLLCSRSGIRVICKKQVARRFGKMSSSYDKYARVQKYMALILANKVQRSGAYEGSYPGQRHFSRHAGRYQK